MKKLSKQNRFLHFGAVFIATLFSMMPSAHVSAQNAIWDHTDIKYGTEDPNRQWLNIYLADSAEPTPVYLFAHGNGGSANNMPQVELDTIASEGYTTVNWESIPTIQTHEDLLITWSDAQLVFDWVRANAAAYNMDPDHIVIGGRSRGSGASWPLAHSGHAAIKGLYMYNALPKGFWLSPELWSPLENVSIDSPPTYLAYGPLPEDVTNMHNPTNVDAVVDLYATLGLGDNITLTDGMTAANLTDIMHYFPEFAATLVGSAEPPNMVDNFDGENTAYPWAQSGPWYISGGTYNLDDINTYNAAYAGNPAWDTYTFTADMITLASANVAQSWMVDELAFRVSNTQNMYRIRLQGNGVLKLRSSVNGVNTVITSVATGYSPFAWHTYRVEVQGDSIQVSIDGDLLISINNSDHATGYIGILNSLSSVSVDNVSVTDILPPGC